jgi:hypothetical protein
MVTSSVNGMPIGQIGSAFSVRNGGLHTGSEKDGYMPGIGRALPLTAKVDAFEESQQQVCDPSGSTASRSKDTSQVRLKLCVRTRYRREFQLLPERSWQLVQDEECPGRR